MKTFFTFLCRLPAYFRLERYCGYHPSEIIHIINNYETVICNITHGLLSKPTYDPKFILQLAQEHWCDDCDVKDND